MSIFDDVACHIQTTATTPYQIHRPNRGEGRYSHPSSATVPSILFKLSVQMREKPVADMY